MRTQSDLGSRFKLWHAALGLIVILFTAGVSYGVAYGTSSTRITNVESRAEEANLKIEKAKEELKAVEIQQATINQKLEGIQKTLNEINNNIQRIAEGKKKHHE